MSYTNKYSVRQQQQQQQRQTNTMNDFKCKHSANSQKPQEICQIQMQNINF